MAEGLAWVRHEQPAVHPRGPIDVTLLAVVASLISIGLLAIYNASAVSSYFVERQADDMHYFNSQLEVALLGLVAMIVGCRIDYRFYQRNIGWIVAGAFALVALTLVPGISDDAKGAARWIQFGPARFQPAEAAKLAAVFYLAYSITKKGAAMQNFVESFVAHGLVFAPFVAVLMAQPDFGSTIIICTMAGLMLFVGGAKFAFMAAFGTAGVVGIYAAIMAESYRIARVQVWLDPFRDPEGDGYHLVRSFTALARGGYTGTGLGEGGSRLGYIPELHNDFVAASVGEEFGFVGLGVLAVLYILFVWRGMAAARGARDTFGSYLAFGITVLIGMQAAINLCVVTGVVPTKGLTLPFVSYGRSSLLVLMFAVGVLLNIGQRNEDLHEARKAAARAEEEERQLQDAARRSVARRTAKMQQHVEDDA